MIIKKIYNEIKNSRSIKDLSLLPFIIVNIILGIAFILSLVFAYYFWRAIS